ncbi:MAG: L-threonylcarbamoyladenylate synthase [Candidatus Aenigmatarchaeota archaeon]
MKILKINPKKPEKEVIAQAFDILKKNGIVVYPTDTLYGLGANALSKQAIIKVYKVKGRDFKKPLSVAFYSLSQAKKYVKFSRLALKLAKKFLPGPLTIILPMKYKFPKELTSGSRNLGIRIPDNKIALELVKKCRFPITATSANISGYKDPVSVEDVIKQIGDKVELILDGGKCKYSQPSTVVEVNSDEIKFVREGVINKRNLMRLYR